MDWRPVRARALGLRPGRYPTGPLNAITDVPGVLVGHTTLVEGTDIRTGVTAVVPAGLAERRTLPAGLFVGNGYGKFVGATQVAELGAIETPIVLTATLSAFRAADALVTYTLGLPGYEETSSINPVVGETNDGYLSDIRRRPITEDHVLAAVRGARSGPVEEGAVGAGTGTGALGFKAGIGTSSRVVDLAGSPARLGVLVQANFAGSLSVLGVPVPVDEAVRATGGVPPDPADLDPGNSCVIVVATDAGLDARQLGRVARRAVFGLARVGSDFTGGSGDYALAVTVGPRPGVADGDLDPLFAAVLECVEEAVLNSLFTARTTVGYRGRVRYGLPAGYVVSRCAERGVVTDRDL